MLSKRKPDENAMHLLKAKYFRENEKEWDDLAERVARGVAKAEVIAEARKHWTKEFFGAISNLEFIPSTPCLLNADETGDGQLSSCFIISLKDNIESIYYAKGECAKIFQKNGGVGLNISVLRPKDSAVETSRGYSCGTIGFMEEFDLTADVVTRNNIRKGAIKIDLNDWHPDIFLFVHCKDDTTKLQRMNISVSLSDAFMEAVEADTMWDLKFPDYSWNKEIYDSEWDGDLDKWEANGYPVRVYQTVSARALYEEIMTCAHRTGEPGVSFRDAMDRFNPNPHIGKVHSTNPCSEFASVPYNSCNLGSINLVNCIDENGEFSILKFVSLVKLGTRFLDNMITVNKLPLNSISAVTKDLRSVGLGVMGFADVLYRLGVAYDSPEAQEFASKLFSIMSETSVNYSMQLADEKGVYPAWEGSTWQQGGIRIRNSNHLSIAPTGSISFIAGVSGGIEPNFALVYTRRTNDGMIYYIVNDVFAAELKKRGLYSDELLQKIVDNHGSCRGIEDIPLDMQQTFVVSHDISPEMHTEMVGVIQNYVDLSISKTVNLSADATVEDVMDVYKLAHRLGCKGITVYRDGSRADQTLAVKREKKEDEETNEDVARGLDRGDWKPKASDTLYHERSIHIGCGKIKLFIGWSESEQTIQDFYIKRVGQGGCERNLEHMTIAMSGMLRLGGNLANIDRAFSGVGGCNSFVRERTRGEKLSKGSNCGSAILNEIFAFLKEKEAQPPKPVEFKEQVLGAYISSKGIAKVTIISEEAAASRDDKFKCPDCGEALKKIEGCISCKSCGFSKCS